MFTPAPRPLLRTHLDEQGRRNKDADETMEQTRARIEGLGSSVASGAGVGDETAASEMPGSTAAMRAHTALARL